MNEDKRREIILAMEASPSNSLTVIAGVESTPIKRTLSLPFNKQRALAALAALALAGCGTVPLEPPPEEPPIFPRIDARVGVVYASAARTPILTNPLLRIEVGKASVARFERVFASMFTQPLELPDWPPWREASAGLDGVIVLEQTDAELMLGDDTGRNPDVVRIAYRVCLYEPGGTEIRCWTPSARHSHQRRVGECLNLQACIVPETEITMREAIARFMVEAEKDPALKAWSERIAPRRISP
jgi:hypothetical protein